MRVLTATEPFAVRAGVFRKDVSLRAFGRLFYIESADLRANKVARWQRFLAAARTGTMLDRPQVAPLWQPHKIYHPPMWDVLQSSYADVEHEMRTMCGLEPPPPAPPGPFKSEQIMFCAGDGLALMRLNHLLHNKSDVYVDMTPMIIPIQGERMCMCVRGAILCACACGRGNHPTSGSGELTFCHRTCSQLSDCSHVVLRERTHTPQLILIPTVAA